MQEVTTMLVTELRDHSTRAAAREKLRELIVNALAAKPRMSDVELWRFYYPQMLPWGSMKEELIKLRAEGRVRINYPQPGLVIIALADAGRAGKPAVRNRAAPEEENRTVGATAKPAAAEMERREKKRQPTRRPKAAAPRPAAARTAERRGATGQTAAAGKKAAKLQGRRAG
jgi:hypothetical protein